MIKVCKLAFFVLLSSMAVAQSDSILETNLITKASTFDLFYFDRFLGNMKSNILEIKGSSMAVSSHLNLEFIKNFYKGGKLDEGLINKNGNRLKNSNRLGIETGFSINWLSFGNNAKDSSRKTTWQAGYKSLTGVRYGQDAFLLFMKGNAQFAGRSADLSKVGYRNMEWIYLGAGSYFLNDEKADKRIFSISGQLVLTGNSLRISTTGNTSIYTDTFGRFLNVAAKGAWSSAQSRPSGVGATLSIKYSALINKNIAYEFGIEDAGPVMYFANTKGRSFDTSFVFSGFYIYDLNNLSNPDYWPQKTDSLITPLTDDKKKETVKIMPALVFSSITFRQSPRTFWNLSISYRLGLFALPQIQLTNRVIMNSIGVFSSSIGYGGWGAFQWDESLTLQKKTWGAQIKFFGMHTWIFKQIPFQAGLQLAISKRF